MKLEAPSLSTKRPEAISEHAQTSEQETSSLTEKSDQELLALFSQEADELAFTHLLQRHGDMVFGVCRRILRNPQDIEDAFQATFLILAQRAGKSVWSSTVGPWLCKVASHTAMAAARKRSRHHHAELEESCYENETEPWLTIANREEQTALYEELSLLPERLRAPLVLCYLEGLSRREAANALQCSDDTVKGRLARGRRTLRVRLARRGFTLSAVLATSLFPTTTSANALTLLVQTTTTNCSAAVLHGQREIFTTQMGTLAREALNAMQRTALTNLTFKLAATCLIAVLFAVGFNTAGNSAAGQSAKRSSEHHSGKVIMVNPETAPNQHALDANHLEIAQAGEKRKPFRLSPGDKLRFECMADPIFDRNLLILPDGTITLPLLGQVNAADLTLKELTQEVEEKYKIYFREPRITISVSELADSRRI
jgi:RNA polymerase sigma factor (sigma-70 family)